ncbi:MULTISPECIES: transporter substrate-binding domain-containing protein [unclassified Isoptericola]|uniref:transporter substrate-binding domain-containing protein n=1 Tax=unclassified Isoptericola TaxID=2623355 RepID=UPI0027131BF8|nr:MULTISPECIES: transporter substrate-binding domain-containing protein [unclassified Isoptericola]MDO8143466.1 transporter substrate-binding domain-containing protein [Isoptericola sp. 178]MDO8147327.1 transporter substrate-binding domain-containing protein [Isoptericola sp. b515]
MSRVAEAAVLAPTGALRAVINLGNPVLAQGTASAPTGVTVDLARALADHLGTFIELSCVDAARDAFAAVRDGQADVGFLAAEPQRAEHVAFTDPYVLIEGVFAVPASSPLRSAADVDAPGVRIGVKEGSAYDLSLTRTLRHAQLVRGAEGTAVFEAEGLDVAAGIRQPVTRWAEDRGDVRVLEPRFTEIRQAVATGRDRSPDAVSWLRDAVADLVRTGFVADSLAASGQDATVPS